jgi:hypothetical protein
MRALASLPLAVALAGCAASTPAPQLVAPVSATEVQPANPRAEIAAYLRATLKDPTSVRDPMIGEPQNTWMGVGYRYTVCVRFNAKNSYGGYTGPQNHLAVFVTAAFPASKAPYPSNAGRPTTSRFRSLRS